MRPVWSTILWGHFLKFYRSQDGSSDTRKYCWLVFTLCQFSSCKQWPEPKLPRFKGIPLGEGLKSETRYDFFRHPPPPYWIKFENINPAPTRNQ